MGEVVAFVVLLVGAGWALRRVRLVRVEAAKDLNQIVFYLTLPPLIFLALHRGELAWDMLAMPGLAWGVSVVGLGLGWLGARLLGLRGKLAGAFILALTFGNTTYFGYPVITELYGERHLTLAIFYDLLGATLAVNTLGVSVAAALGSGAIAAKAIAKKLATFPPIWALALGLALRPIALPEALVGLLEPVGALTTPLMMLSIGLSLELRHWRSHGKPVMAAVAGRLLVLPAVTWGVALALGLPTDFTQAAVMQAGMPTMLYSFTLALLFDLDTRLVLNAILFTTVLSFLTLPLWFQLLGGA